MPYPEDVTPEESQFASGFCQYCGQPIESDLAPLEELN
jgi:hypothetical protein